MYQVRILDRFRHTRAILNGVQWNYSRYINQATEITITIAKEVVQNADLSPDLASYLLKTDKVKHVELASFIQIFRGPDLVVSGVINNRSIGQQTVTVSAYTEEILLEKNVTPTNYGKVFDGWDLADVARSCVDNWYTIRIKDKSQWQDYMVSSSNIDLDTDPGVVMLAKDHNGQYRSSGHITLKFDSGEIPNFKAWDRFRWSSDGGGDVKTTIQLSKNGSSWTPAVDGGLPEEIGVSTVGYNYVRINLFTEDITSEDGEGNKVGTTPTVFACEMIARTRGELVPDIPITAGVTVKGLSADYANAFRVLADACEQVEWEFRVHNNVLSIQERIGVDRTNGVLLRQGTNMEIMSIGDGDEELVNVLTARGTGQGINRIQVVLQDEESIEKFGYYPMAMDFDTDSLPELLTKAQNYLDKYKTPKSHFEVTAVFEYGNEPTLDLGDQVRVADPETGIITKARIEGLVKEFANEGIVLRLELGKAGINLQSVLDRDFKPTPQDPLRPTGVYARTIIEGVVVGCLSPRVENWETTELHMSLSSNFTPSQSTLKESGKQTRFDISNLEPGTRYYFKLRHKDSRGNYSPMSSEVSAVPRRAVPEGGIKDGDFDPTPPDTPENLHSIPGFRSHIVVWDYAERAARYILAWSIDQVVWNEIPLGFASIFSHNGLDPDMEYWYRVKAVNLAGIESGWSEVHPAGKPGRISLSEDIIGQLDPSNLAPESIERVHLDPSMVSGWDGAKDSIENALLLLSEDPDHPDQFAAIKNTMDELRSVKGKAEWTGYFTGRVIARADNWIDDRTQSPNWLNKEVDGQPLDLRNMAVRFTSGNYEGVVLYITEVTEDRLYFGTPLDPLPTLGSTFEVGNAAIIIGTQVRQNAEKIALLADAGELASSLTVTPEQINAGVTFVNDNEIQFSNVIQSYDQIQSTVARVQFAGLYEGEISNIQGNVVTDANLNFNDLAIDIVGLATRFTVFRSGEEFSVIRKIVGISADNKITVDSPFATGWIPSVGSTYEIGNLENLAGTQQDQTNERIRLAAEKVNELENSTAELLLEADKVRLGVQESLQNGAIYVGHMNGGLPASRNQIRLSPQQYDEIVEHYGGNFLVGCRVLVLEGVQNPDFIDHYGNLEGEVFEVMAVNGSVYQLTLGSKFPLITIPDIPKAALLPPQGYVIDQVARNTSQIQLAADKAEIAVTRQQFASKYEDLVSSAPGNFFTVQNQPELDNFIQNFAPGATLQGYTAAFTMERNEKTMVFTGKIVSYDSSTGHISFDPSGMSAPWYPQRGDIVQIGDYSVVAATQQKHTADSIVSIVSLERDISVISQTTNEISSTVSGFTSGALVKGTIGSDSTTQVSDSWAGFSLINSQLGGDWSGLEIHLTSGKHAGISRRIQGFVSDNTLQLVNSWPESVYGAKYMIIYPESRISSTFQQQADSISMRIMGVDANGNPVPNAELKVGSIDNNGYILLNAKDVFVPGTLHVFDDIPGSAAGGKVTINSNGITIQDGKLTLLNPSGRTVIDGTSNMFKIAATGITWAAAGKDFEVNTNVSTWSNLSCLYYIEGFGFTWKGDPMLPTSYFPTFVSEYQFLKNMRAGAIAGTHISGGKCYFSGWTGPDNEGSIAIRWYVMKEEGI